MHKQEMQAGNRTGNKEADANEAGNEDANAEKVLEESTTYN
jgi:hypothetical protein